MKRFFLTLSFVLFIIPIGMSQDLSSTVFAQCLEGESYLSFEITTDTYGYELYFEITPYDDDCGINTLAAYGNTFVGCDGGGLKVATAQDNGAFSNNSTIIREFGCIPNGTQLNIHAVDDYGDGKSVIGIRIDGFLVESFTADATSNSWTYIVNPPNNYDVKLDYDFIDELDYKINHIPPVHDIYYPLNQLTNSETYMGLTVYNTGVQTSSNVYARLNIDRFNESNDTYETVFTDTLKYGNLESNTSKIRFKKIEDTNWQTVGKFRYVYSADMDENDEDESNNSLSNSFEITENYWSKIPLNSNNELEPTNKKYFPPTMAGPNELTKYEWGSLFYFANGNEVIIDKISALLFSKSDTSVDSADVQIRIYEVNIQEDNSIRIPEDLAIVGLAIENLTHDPGNTVPFETTTFYNTSDGSPMGALKNNKLYFISIYQQQQFAPYLSDGQTTSGFYIYGNLVNHDFFSYVHGEINSKPYYNPLIIEYQSTYTSYLSGWNESPEPVLGINLKENVLKNRDYTKTTRAQVLVSPNPTNNKITISLDTTEDLDYTIIITDVTHRVIHIESTKFINNSKQIELEHLNSGVYFINISSNTDTFYQKFIKH